MKGSLAYQSYLNLCYFAKRAGVRRSFPPNDLLKIGRAARQLGLEGIDPEKIYALSGKLVFPREPDECVDSWSGLLLFSADGSRPNAYCFPHPYNPQYFRGNFNLRIDPSGKTAIPLPEKLRVPWMLEGIKSLYCLEFVRRNGTIYRHSVSGILIGAFLVSEAMK
jgi:hypothetical protein